MLHPPLRFTNKNIKRLTKFFMAQGYRTANFIFNVSDFESSTEFFNSPSEPPDVFLTAYESLYPDKTGDSE